MNPTDAQLPFVVQALTAIDTGAKGLFWWGSPGSGKTWCARALARERFHRSFVGRAATLVSETQAAMRNSTARDLWTMQRVIEEVDVVLLDDLGRERDGYGQDVMFQLLDTALASPAFVMVTSNRSPSELAESYGRGDAGLASRLAALIHAEWGEDMPHQRSEMRRQGQALDSSQGPPVSAEKMQELKGKLSFLTDRKH